MVQLVRLFGAEPPRGDAGREYPGLEGIRALGHRHDTYCYLSPITDEIVRLKPIEHNEANLGRLRPLGWWVEHYPPINKARSLFNTSQIRNDLMEISHVVGPFDPDLVRGRGVHWDESLGAVLHAGRMIHVGGAGYRPHQAPGRHVYEAGESLYGMIGAPLAEGEGQRLLDVCEMLPWARPRSAELLAGWIVTALAGAALHWRAHLWLTGEAKTGKTWILEHIVLAALGELALAAEGETTEAGLRQTLGNDARPVVFDEAEGEKKAGAARVERVLALARTNSSAGTGKVLKGGSGHTATAFGGTSAFLLASIAVRIARQADETRWTVVELAGAMDITGEDFAALKRAAAGLDAAFRAGLMTMVLTHLATLRANHALLAEMIGRRHDRRFGDQMGALMAGALLLRSHARLSPAEAEAMADDLPVETGGSALVETDQERCLAALASGWARVTTSGGRRQVTRTLGDLIALALRNGGSDEDLTVAEAEAVLAQHGVVIRDVTPWLRDLRLEERSASMPTEWRAWLMRYWDLYQQDRAAAAVEQRQPRSGRVVLVAATHRELTRILADTDWSQGWNNILKRLPGAALYHGSIRFSAGVKQRAVALPAALFARDDDD